MTTTDDLRSALAEMDRQAAEMGGDSADDHADTGRAEQQGSAAAAAAENEEAAIVAALMPLVDVAMDATIGRFQVAQQNPRAVPEFIALARAELAAILRKGTTLVNAITRDHRAASHHRAHGSPSCDEVTARGLSGAAEDADATYDGRTSPQNAVTALERDVLRSERDRLQASENFLRTVGSEMVGDLTVRTQQVQALQGVVRRRDALLGEQRKAYLRELCHLRTIIKQWETKGFATTNDAGFFNWGDDDLVDRIGADTAQEAADIAAEERARFDKELDSERQRSAKVEDGLRRQVALLEQQLRQASMSAPPLTSNQETNTEEEVMSHPAETLDVEVQTDEVFVADQAPPPGVEGGQDLTAAPPVDIERDTQRVGCPVCASHFKVAVGVPAVATSPRRASKASSRRRSSARPPSGGSTRRESQAAVSTVSAVSPAGPTGADTDVTLLRAELEEQQRQQRVLMSRLQGKEDTLASAAAVKLENDEARRRVESQTIRKLHDEVRAKDALLEKKSRELSQLHEEAKRWFAQYQESLPADHAPVNHAALRRMSDAVSKAESAEEVYRLESWELLALNVKARTVLQGLHDDCHAAESSGDTAGLRMCQRAYDTVGHQMRQRCARARQRRLRLREEANRIWDVVLYYARSVHHAQEPLPPPPRYYSVDNRGESGAASLPTSLMRRRAEIESVMLNHSAAAERANAGRHQVLKLGPVVVDAPPAKASPRCRPGTAPAQRASADLQSPFVHKIRDEVSAEKAARTPIRPAPSSVSESESRPHRSGAAPRPQTAGLARKHGFNPAELAGQPLAARRAALVKLMRHDQDTLAVSKQRHIDGMYRSRAVRGQAPRFRPQSGASDAELFATPGLTQQRLLGRHEAGDV